MNGLQFPTVIEGRYSWIPWPHWDASSGRTLAKEQRRFVSVLTWISGGLQDEMPNGVKCKQRGIGLR